MVESYRICSQCVMDTSDARISFNEEGVCDHCVTFSKEVAPQWETGVDGRRRLDEVVSQIKARGEGKDFDCIIGLSGGIDSSYLTFLAKEELGLRPLVFHVDAGWNTQVAVNNIERLVEGLGLELFTEVINWEEMRDLQLAYFKSGVPHIDSPQDHAFFATMYRFAEEHGVRYILTGANFSTEGIRNPIEWMYWQSDSTQLRDIHSRYGLRPLDTFPMTSALRHKVWLRYIKGIRIVKPLDFVPYVKESAMHLLMDRFGWQPYPQKHWESRFTRFYEGYWLPSRFGFDTRRVQFSSLIVTGQMTRDSALDQLSDPALEAEEVRREFSYVAKKLGIDEAELQRYHEMPKRSFRDYRSQHALYSVGARAMRLLRLERGGKR